MNESKTMAGETNLSVLLKSMKPVLLDEEYVFCTAKKDDSSSNSINFDILSQCQPIGVFHEHEGTTYIITRQNAEKFTYFLSSSSYASTTTTGTTIFRMITLSVHSSLDAIGFLAAITTKLASGGISCNPVSAFYHDHLFIPANNAEEAITLLKEFAE